MLQDKLAIAEEEVREHECRLEVEDTAVLQDVETMVGSFTVMLICYFFFCLLFLVAFSFYFFTAYLLIIAYK